MIEYFANETLTTDDYIEFLARSDLGSEYPRKDFVARIARLLTNVDVCITARNDTGLLVGVCLGLTDFAYFLYLTDLGVDREYARRGIGRTMVGMAHERAGGEADISVITWTNPGVLAFYESCGMPKIACAVGREATDWELFTVTGADRPSP